MNTNLNYSPWDLLPVPEPKTVRPDLDHFYQTTAKHLIAPTVRLMMTGLPIDLDRVEELESHLDEVLAKVTHTIANNKYVKEYLELTHKYQIQAYRDEQQSKMKQPSHFLKPFKHSDMTHRSYFMFILSKQLNINQPSDVLDTTFNIPKWPANTVKKLSKSNPLLVKLLSGQLKDNHPIVSEAMKLLAEHKCRLYNRSYLEKIHKPKIPYPEFNPQSPVDKRGIFELLGIPSEATSSKTGLPKWDRAQVERVNKEFSDDPDLLEFTQALIDHSFGAIVKNNFIHAFYKYTVDGRLYGQYKLFGAKSFRYTSSNPNMLNSPSTGSIYSKPIKRCFVAPKDYIIYAIDLSALEDRVIASLSRDKNKMAVFTDELDGHCLNALGYFREEIAAEMELTGDTITDVKKFFELQENGNKTLKDIRQKGKPATFGLSYGAYPPKVAATLKIPLSEAEQIFDRYHNELYSGITDYRENYILPTTLTENKLHLGMGCYIKSDDPRKDIRTLNNASCQFWSIVTALTVAKLDQIIQKNGLQDLVQITSTIYDSIYLVVKKDASIIKQLNDFIVPIMTADFMENQAIPNSACGEIGPDWASLTVVPNNASIEQIEDILSSIEEA